MKRFITGAVATLFFSFLLFTCLGGPGVLAQVKKTTTASVKVSVTPEQKKKIAEIRKEYREKRKLLTEEENTKIQTVLDSK